MRYLTSRIKSQPHNPASFWNADTPFFDVTQGILRMVKPVKYGHSVMANILFNNKFKKLIARQDQTLIAFASEGYPCLLQPQSASDVQGITLPDGLLKFPIVYPSDVSASEGAGQVYDRATSLLLVSKPVAIPAGKKLWFGLSFGAYDHEETAVACVTAMLRSEWEALPENGFQRCPVTIRTGATLSGTGTINEQSPTWDVHAYHPIVWHPALNRFSPARSIPPSTFGFTFKVEDQPGSNYTTFHTAFNGNGGVFNANWVNAGTGMLFRGNTALAVFDFDAKSVEFSRTIPKSYGTLSAVSGSTHTFSEGDEVVFLIEVNGKTDRMSSTGGDLTDIWLDGRYVGTQILASSDFGNMSYAVFGWDDPAIYRFAGAASIPGERPYTFPRLGLQPGYSHRYRPPGRKYGQRHEYLANAGVYWSVPTNKVYLEAVGLTSWVGGIPLALTLALAGQRIGLAFDPTAGSYGTSYIFDQTGTVVFSRARTPYAPGDAGGLYFLLSQRDVQRHFQLMTAASDLRNLPSGFVAWDAATY